MRPTKQVAISLVGTRRRVRYEGKDYGRHRRRQRVQLLLLALMAGVLGAFFLARLDGLEEKYLRSSADMKRDFRASVTEVARLAFLSGDFKAIRPYLRAVTQGPQVTGVILLDPRGRVVAQMWQGHELSQEEALHKASSSAVELFPVEADGYRLGTLGISLGGSKSAALIEEARILLLFAASAHIGLLVLAGWMFRKILTERAQLICDATARLARGEYSVRIPATGTDPLARIRASFNHMAAELGRSVSQLRASEERFELAVNGSNDCIWDWNISSDSLFLSPRIMEILGYDDAELPARFCEFRGWVHPEDNVRLQRLLEGHLLRDEPFACEFRVRSKVRSWIWMLARGEAVKGNGRTATRMAGSLSDISQQKAAQRALEEEKRRAHTTLRSIVDGVITTDGQGYIQYMNKAAEKLTGWNCEEARGRQLLEVYNIATEDMKPVDRYVMDQVFRTGKVASFGERCILKNGKGEPFLITESVAPLCDDESRISGMVVTFHDITERTWLQRALNRQKELALVTLNAIGDAVITTDVHNKVVYMNPAAERLMGWSGAEARDRTLGEIVSFVNEFSGAGIEKPVELLLQSGSAMVDLGQTKLYARTGRVYTVEHQIAPLRSRQKDIKGSVVVLHDVSDRNELMEELAFYARHDALTHLINRYEFERNLVRAIDLARDDPSTQHVLCYLDLDQFKIINDACGHFAGDEVLRQVADLFRESVRDSDIVARLGGDEFGLLLESCNLADAIGVAENIRRQLEGCRFCWEEKYFRLTASIGLHVIKSDSPSLQHVLSAVDEACYIAKHKGRNQIHVAQAGDEDSHRFHYEIESIPQIHKALNEDRFQLFAQPIVSLDGSCTHRHYEVLLRMRSQRGQILEPGSFLPAAERYGLMPSIDRWVLDSAISTLAQAMSAGDGDRVDVLAINISAAVLNDDDFLDYVKTVMQTYSLPPNRLCFEITETLAIANFSLARRYIEELKQLGCRFALDDFGTGFASFRNLRALPVDYLKIDGSFVGQMLKQKVDFAMVEAINEIGHIMDLKTIAEFVDSSATVEALKAIEVDYAQGYYIGKPRPLSEILCGEIPAQAAAAQ